MSLKVWLYLVGIVIFSSIVVEVVLRSQERTGGLKDDSECIVTGCNGEVCIDKDKYDERPFITTCEFRPYYSCYGRYSACKRQVSGECGWSKTIALKLCLLKRGLY